MLSEKLSIGNQILANQEYTFTFDIKQIFFFTSESTIKQKLQDALRYTADVLSVNRPLFSGYFVVTIVPKSQNTLSYWINNFTNIWKGLGYEVDFVQAEGGTVTTSPGGVQQIAPGIAKVAGATTYEAIKPLLPWLLAAGAGYVIITSYIQKKVH